MAKKKLRVRTRSENRKMVETINSLRAAGDSVKAACKKVGMCDVTYYKWKKLFGKEYKRKKLFDKENIAKTLSYTNSVSSADLTGDRRVFEGIENNNCNDKITELMGQISTRISVIDDEVKNLEDEKLQLTKVSDFLQEARSVLKK